MIGATAGRRAATAVVENPGVVRVAAQIGWNCMKMAMDDYGATAAKNLDKKALVEGGKQVISQATQAVRNMDQQAAKEIGQGFIAGVRQSAKMPVMGKEASANVRQAAAKSFLDSISPVLGNMFEGAQNVQSYAKLGKSLWQPTHHEFGESLGKGATNTAFGAAFGKAWEMSCNSYQATMDYFYPPDANSEVQQQLTEAIAQTKNTTAEITPRETTQQPGVEQHETPSPTTDIQPEPDQHVERVMRASMVMASMAPDLLQEIQSRHQSGGITEQEKSVAIDNVKRMLSCSQFLTEQHPQVAQSMSAAAVGAVIEPQRPAGITSQYQSLVKETASKIESERSKVDAKAEEKSESKATPKKPRQ